MVMRGSRRTRQDVALVHDEIVTHASPQQLVDCLRNLHILGQ
jgi:hypothetical protein